MTTTPGRNPGMKRVAAAVAAVLTLVLLLFPGCLSAGDA